MLQNHEKTTFNPEFYIQQKYLSRIHRNLESYYEETYT